MQHTPSDYRTMAALCLEIANGMSAEPDRAQLNDVAQRWLELAQKSEAEPLPDRNRGIGEKAKRDEESTSSVEPEAKSSM